MAASQNAGPNMFYPFRQLVRQNLCQKKTGWMNMQFEKSQKKTQWDALSSPEFFQPQTQVDI